MRQAVSPMLSTVMLVAISVTIAVIVSAHYLGINYDSISCDVLSAELFQITPSKYWGMVQFWNDGDYQIYRYSIIIHHGTQSDIIHTINDVDVSPKETITEDFEIDQTIQSGKIILEIQIQNDSSVSSCMGVIIR